MNRREFLLGAVASYFASFKAINPPEQANDISRAEKLYTYVANKDALTFTIPDNQEFPVGTAFQIINVDEEKKLRVTADGDQQVLGFEHNEWKEGTLDVLECGVATIYKHSEDRWFFWGQIGDIV